MGLALVFSRGCVGIEAPLITIEVHIAGGLPVLSMVGLPETAVKEAKDRVRSALINAGFEWPASRITVALAPADLPKEGGGFDLPIALGILAASGQVPDGPLADCEFLGELSLNGGLRPVRGVLPAAIRSRDSGRALVIPADNADEAALHLAVGLGADRLFLVSDVPGVVLEGEPLPEIDAEAAALTDAEVQEAIDEVKLRPADGKVDEISGLSASQIRLLPVPVRVKLARNADRQMRALLIRDTNVRVAVAVLHNSSVNDQEIELIASSRNVVDEVLDFISKRREWIRKYSVARALVKNPRTHLATAIQLVPRMVMRDLRDLSRDRNVPDGVRTTAKRLYLAKR